MEVKTGWNTLVTYSLKIRRNGSGSENKYLEKKELKPWEMHVVLAILRLWFHMRKPACRRLKTLLG